jgi:tRNA threonylcarbamoyladenosine biosynthesis protein TsaB
MGIILNLETATTNCSVSLAKDGKLLALRENNTPNYSHAEQLHVFIAECMAEAKIALTDLDAVAVSKGPGSYTGLRIGVSAAKGLCFSLDAPLISIATLTSLASQVKGGYDCIIPVLDARRMEVYSAVFDIDLNQIKDTEAEIIDEHSFRVYAQDKTVHILGSGAQKIKETRSHDTISFNTDCVPSSKEMAVLSHQKYLKSDFEDVAYFEPYYLKDFMLQTKKK